MTTTFALQRPDAPPRAAVRRRNATALAMLAGLPVLTYYLWICLTFYGGAFVLPTSPADVARLLDYIPAPTRTALFVYAAWLLVQVVLHVALPGRACEGTPLADATRLKYRLNGWSAFWIC